MEVSAILAQINELPTEQRIFIAEKILHTIRTEDRIVHGGEPKLSLKEAAALAYNDYKNAPELTAFTCLDGENFYEYETR
jgi:hypothetical protein